MLVTPFLSAEGPLRAQETTPDDAPALPPAAEAAVTPSVSEPLDINMPADTLSSVLQLLERLTGRYVLRAQNLPSPENINIVANNLTASEAITAIETTLGLNGIAVTPLGDKFFKVVPIGQARMEAPQVLEGSALDLPPSSLVVMKLFRLQFMRAQELMQLIPTVLNTNISQVTFNERANAVLLTDTVSNLQVVERFVRQLDRPITGNLKSKFYALNFAKASDIVTKIRTILQTSVGTQANINVNLNADDRTNQVILVSDPGEFPFYDDLIAKLDVRAEPNTRNEVIYLKHATARDVATLLTTLITGRSQETRTDQSSARAGQPQGEGGGPPQYQPGGPRHVTPESGSANAPAAGPKVNVSPAAAELLAEASQGSEFSERITVTFDERSNAIVVSGTVDDIRLISNLVAKIDVLLAQVRIEVVIAEVTLRDTDRTGIEALNLAIGTDDATGTRIRGFSGRFNGWDVTSGVVDSLAFEAALGNAGDKSNVRILSAPAIVTTHAKKASITVGQKQPIITGSQSTLATGGAVPISTSTFTYQEIAINLKVTPLIGNDGSVQLTIDQKVDDVIDSVTIDNNQQPVIGTRQASSFINVHDGQVAVLGGLQRTRRSAERTKLGFFREIPVISHLFGRRETKLERTELLLFIRPHIIRPEEVSADADKQIDNLSSKEEVRSYLEDPAKLPKGK